ncbi:helix-hairpin-helix domain-containing protein [Paenibacillus sp. N4]|uniref:helix-hairpin-helix domain-containing protein n=1 Tax=Paenibacillus vietnamensis TaxID=2590547 RepID=UPI001CD10C18|nr:helix-hairpin-helix domain-containing protein [Paenibacillus vietnamensis]MCA0756365.1 helix-hairpin-helix domain-containing protein [Paenibacillus vietnamensis]
MSTPKLPLTESERKHLRQAKLKLNELANMTAEQLCVSLEVTEERAAYLLAMARFQRIPSIGPKLAHHLVELGFYSLEDIKAGGESGAELVERLERLHGVWMDPCVEDVMRLAVHHAAHPGSGKQWWDFTVERKSYREKHGYPSDRPAKAWYDKS